MDQIDCMCSVCCRWFQRKRANVNLSKKLGASIYCSRNCSRGVPSNKHCLDKIDFVSSFERQNLTKKNATRQKYIWRRKGYDAKRHYKEYFESFLVLQRISKELFELDKAN